MEDKYKGFKITKLEYVEPNKTKLDSWSTIGYKEKYICPECQYLGKTCPKCSDKY